MKILILGASGRTGKLVVDEAVRNGYMVRILVRDKSKTRTYPAAVEVFKGSPTDKKILITAMQGCSAVLSALNISRTSDFPWAALRTPKDFISASIKNVIEAADQLNISRIIVVSAWGVGETKSQIPFWFRWMIDCSNIRFGYIEHQQQEKLLKNSSLNYTCIRPAILTNSTKVKQPIISIGNSPKPSLFISRLNVARFMISTLTRELYDRKMPTISE